MNASGTNHVIAGNSTLDMYDDANSTDDLDQINTIYQFEQAFPNRRYFLGGPGANVAFRLSQLTDNVGIFTITGTKNDPFAKGAREAYQRMNLTCAHLVPTTQRMARCAYFLGTDKRAIYDDNASSEFPNIDIDEQSRIKRFPLNSRLVNSSGVYRYIVDRKGYRWIPEYRWERHARKYLRRAHFQVVLTDGTIIKA